MIEIIEIISTVGFPIAVAVYLLYTHDKSIKDMTELLIQIKVLLEERER